MPICGGSNNLKTLSNSALFGGAGTFINPQQTVIPGQNGITEAGLGIAVDLNGWGQAGVTGVAPSGFQNEAGFPDIVGFNGLESNGSCSGGQPEIMACLPRAAR